jgi:transposase InsO family protein
VVRDLPTIYGGGKGVFKMDQYEMIRTGCRVYGQNISEMVERMTKNLVSQSLLRAFTTKQPAPGLLHHSDRGSQYCALEFATLRDKCGMRASMSRKGNCYDHNQQRKQAKLVFLSPAAYERWFYEKRLAA